MGIVAATTTNTTTSTTSTTMLIIWWTLVSLSILFLLIYLIFITAFRDRFCAAIIFKVILCMRKYGTERLMNSGAIWEVDRKLGFNQKIWLREPVLCSLVYDHVLHKGINTRCHWAIGFLRTFESWDFDSMFW